MAEESTTPEEKLIQAYRTEKGAKRMSRGKAMSIEGMEVTPIVESGIRK